MRAIKPERIRLAVLFAALLMVAVGLLLCRLEAPLAPSVAAAPTGPIGVEERSPPDGAQPAPNDAAPAAELTSPPAQPSAQDNRREDAAPAPAPKPQKVTEAAARKRAAPAKKAVSQAYLPPFQPTLRGATRDGPSGPPPNVLWLSGVIQGEPDLAVLRQGEHRYLVREGDAMDNGYRVAQIFTDKVKLERRGKNRVLRVGQY